MEITPALPSEADVLTSIALASKRHWGYPEKWIDHWRGLLTITSALIAGQDVFAARDGDRILGFAALALEEELLRLEHLWVLPAEMRRGVGRALFHHARQRARQLGFRTFEVESDPHAFGFYERMGAEQIRTTTSVLEGQMRELPVFSVTA
jgi:GNAT superfamily N-acetyltransferase